MLSSGCVGKTNHAIHLIVQWIQSRFPPFKQLRPEYIYNGLKPQANFQSQ